MPTASDGPYLKEPGNASTCIGDVSIETIHHSGALLISAMRGGTRASKMYFGYTQDEALELFNAEFPEDKE
jgi:hypothetical protein